MVKGFRRYASSSIEILGLFVVIGFDGAFFSCYLGCVKEDREYHEAVLEKLKLNPSEILFVDDEEENVEAAQKMGLRVVFYRQFSDLEKAINER